MAKTIAYSDFLKEGALQPKKQPKQVYQDDRPKPFRIVPEDISNETESKAFWKRLRHYFRTGERPDGHNGVFVPALIAPYLRNGNWDTEYPYYLAQESATSQSIEQLFINSFDLLFDENEAKVLRLNLVRLIQYFREEAEAGVVEFEQAKKKAFKKLAKLDVHDEEGERFKTELKELSEILPDEGHVLTFHHEVPLLLIRQKLEQIEWNRNQLKERIHERLKALKELIALNQEKEGKDLPEKGFEFATDMIALNKVQEMLPKQGSELIDNERIQRITALIAILDRTLQEQEHHAHVVVYDRLKDEYRWEEIFSSSTVHFTGLADAFEQTKSYFDRSIADFTEVLIAMRKADLELEDKYDVNVHDDFFEHFKWFKLDEEELNIFPPILLFAHSNDLLNEGLSDFSKLMTTNKLIKVVALKDRTFNPSDPNIDWEDASLGHRQELAAIALSHRNVHTLQCATDRPDGLLNGIRSGMNSIAPSLMHLLVTKENEEPHISFLKINAAAAGRYFPYILYDPHMGKEWGSRFDVMDNSQPEQDWPVYPFDYQAEDENMVQLNLAFTYADYKAMNQEKVEELFIVPEGMVNDYLVPLHDYLYLSQADQTGKVPFIWMIDEDNVMIRLAVPYMWVASCLERLEFWNFIQELGGVDNYHVNVMLEASKLKWEEAKQSEMEVLKGIHQEELNQAKLESASVAMDKLASVLLDLEHMPTVQATPINESKSEAEPVQEQEQPVVKETAEPETEDDGPLEAYIEQFRCTSCNDCTDMYPAIFSYNEDKQAYIKDASKGTFEDLVMAAESCPALCIHPGDPLDPTEPNLEELKIRAAELN